MHYIHILQIFKTTNRNFLVLERTYIYITTKDIYSNIIIIENFKTNTEQISIPFFMIHTWQQKNI